MTDIQQFANDVNMAYPLKESLPENDSAWDCVSGSHKKTYYERSPYSSIDCYTHGYVVHNHVVGSQFPCRTWDEANQLRQEISARYKTISAGYGSRSGCVIRI